MQAVVGVVQINPCQIQCGSNKQLRVYWQTSEQRETISGVKHKQIHLDPNNILKNKCGFDFLDVELHEHAHSSFAEGRAEHID